MLQRSSRRISARILACTSACILASACTVIPNDGPSARVIAKSANKAGDSALSLVELDFKTTDVIDSIAPAPPKDFSVGDSTMPTNIISEGDILSISVFEPNGSALFQADGSTSPLTSPGSSQEVLPRLVVSANGTISVPFGGSVRVAGLTPEGASAAIRNVLRKRVVNPQVVVNVLASNANSVSVIGEVRNVGRFPLSANADRLIDVITAAGGPTKAYQDIEIQIVRDGSTAASMAMVDLMHNSALNIRLAPKDQIRLMPKERRYGVFGAFGRVNEMPIAEDHVSLARAIARAGGLDTYTADNSAVFVFRFERPEVARRIGVTSSATSRGVPLVYRLDMKSGAAALLVADNFFIHNDDLIYVPRADIVAVSKFMQVANAVAQTGYSVKVTGVP